MKKPSLMGRAKTQLRDIRVHIRHDTDGLGRCVRADACSVSTPPPPSADVEPSLHVDLHASS